MDRPIQAVDLHKLKSMREDLKDQEKNLEKELNEVWKKNYLTKEEVPKALYDHWETHLEIGLINAKLRELQLIITTAEEMWGLVEHTP